MNQSQIPEMVELLGLLDYVPAAHRSRSHRLLLELVEAPKCAPQPTVTPVLRSSGDTRTPEGGNDTLPISSTWSSLVSLDGFVDQFQTRAIWAWLNSLRLHGQLRAVEIGVTLTPRGATPPSGSASPSTEEPAREASGAAGDMAAALAMERARADAWRDKYNDDTRVIESLEDHLAETLSDRDKVLKSRDEWRQRALGDEDRITALEAQLAELSPVKPADIAEAFANARAAEEEELDEDEEDGVLSVDVQVHEPLIDESTPLFDIKLAPDVVMVENDGNSEPETEPVVPLTETASEATPELDIPVVAKECNCSQEHWQNTRRFTARERNEGHELSCPMYLKGAHFFPLPGPGETDGSGVYVATCAWCGETKEIRPYGEDSQTYGALGSKSKDLKAKREASASTKAKGYVPASELTPEELQARKDKRCLDCGTPTGGWSPRCRDCNQKRKAQPETAAAS